MPQFEKTIPMALAEKVVKHFNNTPGATVRSTAIKFGIGKSTVHRILTKVLPNEISRAKLDENKRDRSRRGGLAAARKRRRERILSLFYRRKNYLFAKIKKLQIYIKSDIIYI